MILLSSLYRLKDNRFLKSVFCCLLIVLVFSTLAKVNLAEKILYEISYSDPLWEIQEAKYFATTGDFDFPFKLIPSESLLMLRWSRIQFMLHSYIIGLVGYVTKWDILALTRIYSFLFYIIGMASIFYLLWSILSLSTAFIAVIIGFFNPTLLHFLFDSLSDNSQIAISLFLVIFTMLSLKKPFIFIFLLYVSTLLTASSVGSTVMTFLILFYMLHLIISTKNKDYKSAKGFLLNIFSIFSVTLIIYSLLHNNFTMPFLKLIILNIDQRLSYVNFINLGFLYIIVSLAGVIIFLKDNFKKHQFQQHKLLLITSMAMLLVYLFLRIFLKGLDTVIEKELWNIFAHKFYIYILPLILFMGYSIHKFIFSIRGRGVLKYIICFLLLVIVFAVQKINYVYCNVRATKGAETAFNYIVENLKKRIGLRYKIPDIESSNVKGVIYHQVDKFHKIERFHDSELAIPYTDSIDLEKKIAMTITDNYHNYSKNIVVNSIGNGLKIAMLSGCSVLSKYITPEAWETIFISDDEDKTYDILHDPDKYRSDYIITEEYYHYFPEFVKTLPSSKRKYNQIDYVIFYYKDSLNLEKGLGKFLNHPSAYGLIREYNRNTKRKIYVFKVL